MIFGRWWKDLGLIDKLDFTRDRVVESFLCAVGLTVDPEHNSFRKWLTKVVIMILILDDVYDVYGSVEELEQFTVAIDR
ncbi:Alpha-farnesene synthase [Linum perenne]